MNIIIAHTHTHTHTHTVSSGEDDDSSDDSSDDSDLEGVIPTPKRRKQAREQGLKASRNSGRYPPFLGNEGPTNDLDPTQSNAFDYLQLVWPSSLCSLLATETNRYALQRRVSNWVNTTTAEIWTFLGIILLMGIHKLPRINNYWSRDKFMGISVLHQYMTSTRFWALWSNLHVVDNESIPDTGGISRKVKPVIDVLNRTFLEAYNPGQELGVDESMVKYKGRVGGKVAMPKKPIKKGFKIWCCSCSCCGYLCHFQLYEGRKTDLATGKKVSEHGLVKRVVKELVEPFNGLNHVVYCDNYYSSGPLVEELARDSIYFAGTIKESASGFPDSLKGVKPPKGCYVAETVGDLCYYVFHDRKIVKFVTNVFPEHMHTPVARLHPEGVFKKQSVPPILPAYNIYMCAVDRTNQLGKNYDIDRKSKRYWLRIHNRLFNIAVNNAYILYKHSCIKRGIKPKDDLAFRLELVHCLLDREGLGRGVRVADSERVDMASSERVCYLEKLTEIPGLKRGRCRQCQLDESENPRHTTYGCGVCRVRLCKIGCFKKYHNY